MKIGRTHLMDATPIRLGQEFSGYARQVELGIRRIEQARVSLAELALGGTAVGTGLNAHPEFPKRVIARLSELTGIEFREAENHFEAQGAQDALVEVSGALKTVAVSFMKIANDIRWMGSGPRCGIGEILLPELQPGSSIMPGKVNPVIAESVIQVAAQVLGNDTRGSLGRTMGCLGSQHDDAGDGAQSLGVDSSLGGRGRQLRGALHCGHRGRSRALRRTHRAESIDVHGSGTGNWL